VETSLFVVFKLLEIDACSHTRTRPDYPISLPLSFSTMKPRPTTVSTLAIGLRPNAARTNLQSRRNAHVRAIIPALSCHVWHADSQNTRHRWEGVENRTRSSHRYASTAAVPVKPSYGRAPPPPSKTSKANVPAKTDHFSKISPPVKLSTVPEVPIVKAKENLNPPLFTYAADLTVPARKADQSLFSSLYKTGRAYISFYKTGVSNVRTTSKLARSLRERAAKAPGQQTVLTRAEWQVVHRSRKDMLRLPAFGLIFLVFGEWTPLLVKWLTPIIPEPCRIPSQVEKEMKKAEKKRAERLRSAGRDSMRLQSLDQKVAGISSTSGEHGAAAIRTMKPLELPLVDLVLHSARYDCHGRIFDLLRVTPPKFWLQRNVRKHVEYLRKDDELIEKNGGYQGLEKREVERACFERGMDVLGKKEEDLRRMLGVWYSGEDQRRR
jgi:hypothetical protein